MAFVVIANHVGLLANVGYNLVGTTQFVVRQVAVPVFFSISSFFFFRKYDHAEDRVSTLLGFEKRIFVLYAFWIVFNLPYIWIKKDYFHPMCINSCFTIIRDFLLNGVFGASWYLGAMMIGMLVITLLKRYLSPWILLPTFSIIALSIWYKDVLPFPIDLCYSWFSTHLFSPKLSFLESLFWLELGYIMSRPKVLIAVSNLQFHEYIYAYMLSFAVSFLCTWIGVVLFVLTIFCQAYNADIDIIHRDVCTRFRTYSTWFYCMHMQILVVLQILLDMCSIHYNLFTLYILILVSLIIVSTVMYWVKDYKYFQWLKFSY